MEAIRAKDKTIGAFVCHADHPRAAKAGPLRGIAVGIKDIMDTAEFPTEMGSPIYRGFRSRGDASVVMMLKQAGASVAGKTTTTAFASVDPTRRRSIRTIMATRRADRHRVRRQRWRPA
jgi:Asp-tRNA(Asn)/Glu-tRNA(Gln) amidotransferase A subunit family amidase